MQQSPRVQSDSITQAGALRDSYYSQVSHIKTALVRRSAENFKLELSGGTLLRYLQRRASVLKDAGGRSDKEFAHHRQLIDQR
jgi:hypothetical protein